MERASQPAPPAGAHNEDVPTMDTSKLLTGSNMYKLPKGRNMRANYVDVMNPGGSKSSTASSNMLTPMTSPLVPMATSSPQLFVPAPSKSHAKFFFFPTSIVSLLILCWLCPREFASNFQVCSLLSSMHLQVEYLQLGLRKL